MSTAKTTQTTYELSLFDVIDYLASLVSDPHAIDGVMDQVKEIKDRVKPGEEPEGMDRALLQQARARLENYLATKEGLRTFTHPSIDARVTFHFYYAVRRAKQTNILRGPVGVIALATSLAVLVPLLVPSQTELDQRVSFLLANVILMFHLGAACLFLLALVDFADKFRRGYENIAIGVALLGVSQLAQPVLQTFNLMSSPFAQMGGPLLLVAIAMYAIYRGLRNIVAHLKIDLPILATGPVAIMAVVVAAFGIISPHGPLNDAEAYYDISLFLLTLILSFSFAATLLAHSALTHLSKLYAQTVKHLYRALFVTTVGVGMMFIGRIVIGDVPPTLQVAIIAPLVLSGALWMRAGLSFYKIGRY